MTPAGIARIRACFENLIEVYPVEEPRKEGKSAPSAQQRNLPQMPQLPQQQACAGKPLSDQEDAFEERAAIIEYDSGVPRLLAEFLAGRGRSANVDS